MRRHECGTPPGSRAARSRYLAMPGTSRPLRGPATGRMAPDAAGYCATIIPCALSTSLFALDSRRRRIFCARRPRCLRSDTSRIGRSADLMGPVQPPCSTRARARPISLGADDEHCPRGRSRWIPSQYGTATPSTQDGRAVPRRTLFRRSDPDPARRPPTAADSSAPYPAAHAATVGRWADRGAVQPDPRRRRARITVPRQSDHGDDPPSPDQRPRPTRPLRPTSPTPTPGELALGGRLAGPVHRRRRTTRRDHYLTTRPHGHDQHHLESRANRRLIDDPTAFNRTQDPQRSTEIRSVHPG